MNLNPQRSRQEMLMIALSNSETLTEWEADFIMSIIGHWEDKGYLTPAQLEKLEEINTKDELRK